MDVEKISNGLELLCFTSTDSHTWLIKISQGTFCKYRLWTLIITRDSDLESLSEDPGI